MSPPICLTIAGSDCSGGAGLQADLKTFEAFGVYGASVVTLITAQNTQGVTDVDMVAPAMVRAQLRAVFDDLDVAAVKIGALGNEDTMRIVAEELAHFSGPVILDPVMVSKHGSRLLNNAATFYLARHLVPIASLITPNRAEAAALLGEDLGVQPEWQEDAARRLAASCGVPVLITGGSASGDHVIDAFSDGVVSHASALPRLPNGHQHGAGCTLAAAITASIAKGADLREAVQTARSYVWNAMNHAPAIGHGEGPLWHRAASD